MLKIFAGYVNIFCNLNNPTYPITTIPTSLGNSYSFEVFPASCSRCVEHNIPYSPYTLNQLWTLRVGIMIIILTNCTNFVNNLKVYVNNFII